MENNNNDIAMAALMSAATDGAGQPAPTEPTTPVAPVQIPQANPEPAQPAVVEPQPTEPLPMELQALIQGQNHLTQSMQAIQEQLSNPPQPQAPLSDEEQAIKELKEKLGIVDNSSELAGQISHLQKQIEAQQLQADVSSFRAERPDADEKSIMEYISKMTPQMQQAMDNPQGWRLVDDLLKAQTQPQVNQDQIIPSQTMPGSESNAIQELQKGNKPSRVSIGDAILRAASGS